MKADLLSVQQLNSPPNPVLRLPRALGWRNKPLQLSFCHNIHLDIYVALNRRATSGLSPRAVSWGTI